MFDDVIHKPKLTMNGRQAAMTVVILLSCPVSYAFALTPEQVFERAAQSIVTIATFNSQGEVDSVGSGVVIAPREVITNCHVIAGAASVGGRSGQKKSSSIMMLVGIFAQGNRYSSDYIANYANVYVLDALKRVPGAGQAQIMGSADQAMRIWMNPDRMASLSITTSDIQDAVNKQNALSGAGQIGQPPTSGPVELTFPVTTQRPFTEPTQYEQIILRGSQDGSAVVAFKPFRCVVVILPDRIGPREIC